MSAVQAVAMIKNGAPHVIHSDKHLAEYAEALFALTVKARPTRVEEETIELLTLLIERYEDEHYSVPDASPADVLRFLIEQNGLRQRDLIPEFGNEAMVSLILSGKRRLTCDHIARLSERFHVSPAVFFERPKPRKAGSRA